MSTIINLMEGISDLSSMRQGCSETQLIEAEKQLGMKFPRDYVEYVRKYGCVDFGSTEWTGLNINGRLNTVVATQKEMSVNPAFPEKHFVLEDLNIDAKKIIVNEEGEIFLLQYDKRKKMCNSLVEYLKLCIESNKK